MKSRQNKETPYCFPHVLIKDKVWHNNSQKKRYLENTQKLLDLKHFIEKNSGKELELIKEFFMKNGVYTGGMYGLEKISNFASFLDNFQEADSMKSMKQLIAEGCAYGEEETKIDEKKVATRVVLKKRSTSQSKEQSINRTKIYEAINVKMMSDEQLIDKVRAEIQECTNISLDKLGLNKVEPSKHYEKQNLDQKFQIEKIKKKNKMLEFIIVAF